MIYVNIETKIVLHKLHDNIETKIVLPMFYLLIEF